MANDRVAELVHGRDAPLGGGHDPAVPLRPGYVAHDAILEFGLRDQRALASGGEQRRFVDDVGEVGASSQRCARWQLTQEILSYAAAHAAEIRKRSKRSDRPLPAGTRVSVRGMLTQKPYVGPVIAEDLVSTGDSSVTQPGVPRGLRRTGRYRTLRIPVYDRFTSSLDRTVPVAYTLPASDTAMVRQPDGAGLRSIRSGRPLPSMSRFLSLIRRGRRQPYFKDIASAASRGIGCEAGIVSRRAIMSSGRATRDGSHRLSSRAGKR